MRYQAPIDDLSFIMNDLLKITKLSKYKKYEDASSDIISAVMDEAAKLTADVIQPINKNGDIQGCQYDAETKSVKTPDGFKEAYKEFSEGGWTGLDAPVEYGGQGLPHVLKFAIDEMVCATCISFGMYPGLTHGAISAIHKHGSDQLKEKYLEKLISGEWSGTMCLTEPQCGTDLGLIKTKAEPKEDGTYSITGNKIWISGGDQDLTDNIVHLVLAKLPGAPDTTKGISLFIVPKFNPESGERNSAFCGGLEHKMGIKGSATCVMNFEGAKGWLVGNANEGMKAMFTMMNEARLGVGMQGLGIAEMAYQESLGFAKERLQGRSLSGPKNPDGVADSIIVHPDVRRMLMRQKSLNEGMRALALYVGYNLDVSKAEPDEKARDQADDVVQLLTPVVKAFLTDEGFKNANTGLQLLGGSGFTTDWPLEQLVRDARIACIYEGTNGIQALDLVGRKLGSKNGRLIMSLFAQMTKYLKDNPEATHRDDLKASMACLEKATRWIAMNGMKDSEQAGAAATPYLRIMGLVVIAWLWSQMATLAKVKLEAGEGNKEFLEAKVVTAKFYFQKVLPEIDWLIKDIESGKDDLMELSESQF